MTLAARLIILLAALLASPTQAFGPAAAACATSHSAAPTCPASRSSLAMAARTPAVRKSRAPAAGNGKIPGLTKLAPLKVYGVAAALLWAVVGSL